MRTYLRARALLPLAIEGYWIGLFTLKGCNLRMTLEHR